MLTGPKTGFNVVADLRKRGNGEQVSIWAWGNEMTGKVGGLLQETVTEHGSEQRMNE